MKTLFLFLIGLLISGMSFSQITKKKVVSEVADDGAKISNVVRDFTIPSTFPIETDRQLMYNKVKELNFQRIKSGITPSKTAIGTMSPAGYFTNYDMFITKLTNLTGSADSSALLNTFWDELVATGNFPFAIGTKVAFLYRGTANTISWAGMFNNWDMNADAGHRLGISNIWILEKEFPKDTRCEYKVVKNGSKWLADPNNPHPLVGDYGNSELWMPGYSKHTELIPQSGISKGTLSANFLITSSHLGYSCQYRIYTPAGYNNLSNLPTIYVTDGQKYLDDNMGKMIIVLDNLIADNVIEPVIAVFLDPRDPNNLSNDRRGNEYRNNVNFANYVTQELIPVIDAAYKTSTSADARAIMGASYGGYNAAYFSVAAKDYFHNIGINSAYLHPVGNYSIDSKLRNANLDNMKLYLSYGTFDANGERYFNRLKNIFDTKGKAYDYTIVGDGHTWQNWSRVIGDALVYFYAKSLTGTLTLTYPDGGEYFRPDSLVTILWEADSVANIKIEYSTNNGANWNTITASVSASTGKFDWTVPNEVSEQCKIKISDAGNASVSDESSHVFEIGNDITGYLLQMIVDNSINYYRTLKQNNQISGYKLVVIPAAEWPGHSAKVQWNFEPGYVEGNKIYITKPHTTAQLKVFPDIESGLRYTVAKEMLLRHLATNAPDWFQYGYAAYEAQLDRPYETIRAIYAANGAFPDLSEFDTFDPENNIQQRDLAFTMGEYCMLILGDHPKFPSFDANGITVLTGNQTAANGFWHLFLEKHYLKSTDQVKILVKNERIAIYGASKDAPKAQSYLDTLTSQLRFYESSFQVNATHRLNILINPDKCTQLLVEGYECKTPEGGGGHGSGLAGCAFVSPGFHSYRDFIWLMSHEFTHVYQFWMKSNFMPAWLSEGFASCLPRIKLEDSFLYLKNDMFNKWTVVRQNLGRDPTISELMDYGFVRNNNIDYYGMGWLMVDYIIKKDGYLALRNIIESDGKDFTSMGFSSKEDFMEYFYHYFNIRIMEEKIVTLTAPLSNTYYSAPGIDFKWTALNKNIALDLKISTNAGSDWTDLFTQSDRSNYSWSVPSGFTGDFYLKFSAPGNLNISNTYGPFTVSSQTSKLILGYPNGGEYFIPGDLLTIRWENTPVSDIKIEYSSDNGSNWTEIATGISTASGSYDWTVPEINSNQCKLRITDISDASVLDESDSIFAIGPASVAGGPYAVDDNTVLLLHFENNLNNSSPLSSDGNYHGDNLSYGNSFKSTMGHYLKLDGTSYVSVPHNSNLNLTGDWTIEAWVYFNSIGSGSASNPAIVSKANANGSNYFMWYHNNSGSLKGQFTNTGNKDIFVGIGNNVLKTGKWYHIAYIRDNAGNTHRLIIRDRTWNIIAQKEYKYNASASTPILNSEDVLIGKLFATSNFYVDGYIDEVRISNVVRSFVNTTGISETSFSRLISVYPNPAGTFVYIAAPETVDLAIFSLTGQKVMERKDFSSGNINVSTFKKGIYVIRFSGRKGVVSKKLIIE